MQKNKREPPYFTCKTFRAIYLLQDQFAYLQLLKHNLTILLLVVLYPSHPPLGRYALSSIWDLLTQNLDPPLITSKVNIKTEFQEI